jgi:hypothetical protein
MHPLAASTLNYTPSKHYVQCTNKPGDQSLAPRKVLFLRVNEFAAAESMHLPPGSRMNGLSFSQGSHAAEEKVCLLCVLVRPIRTAKTKEETANKRCCGGALNWLATLI